MNDIHEILKLLFDPVAFTAMPVVHVIDGNSYVTGSATYIGPGLFITATHTVEDWGRPEDFRFDPRVKELPSSQYAVDVLHLTKNGPPLRWHITSYHPVGDSDITILRSNEYTGPLGNVFTSQSATTSLDFHLPKIGDIITVAGFPGFGKKKVPHELREFELHKNTHVVEDVDFFGMPNLKSPAIQTRAPIMGGMSGGPVFNSKGRLIGICSAGIEPKDSEQGIDYYTSWISLISPILSSEITVNTKDGRLDATIHELSKNRLLNAHGLSRIAPDKDGFNYLPIVNYCDECEDKLNDDIRIAYMPQKRRHH